MGMERGLMDERSSDHIPYTRVDRSPDQAREAYDQLSAWYDLFAGSSEAAHVKVGVHMMAPSSGERLLEIGFGTGRALVSLAQGVGEAGRSYGLDLSARMAARAVQRLEEAGISEQVGLVLGDGAHPPFKGGIFDGIFMSFMLELFDTPRLPGVLKACACLLKEGGRLCVVSLAKRGRGSLSVRLYEWVHQQMPRWMDCRPIPVQELLREEGFEIVHAEQRSMWTLPVDVVLTQRNGRGELETGG